MSWRTKRLGEVLKLQRGHDLPEHQRKDGDVPVVSSSGVTGWHNEPKTKGPGVVTGRYGTLGCVYYVADDFWPLNTALYVTDFKGNHSRYIAYLLENVLRNLQSEKSAVPGVNRNVLHELEVRTTDDGRLQHRIADILSAYDDLIENNRRRMALLENAARELYREWFVRLRFPGHEHTRILDGVPEGWERRTLGDLCTDIRESVDTVSIEPNVPYIGLEHIPRRSISLSEWGKAEEVTSRKFVFREGEILFGKIRPYFHKVGITFVDGVTSVDSIVIRPSEPNLLELVLMTVSSDAFVAHAGQTMKEGSKMPRADWKVLKQYLIPVPPDGIRSPFNEVVFSIIGQLKALTFGNRNLRAARDLILPRLMSGEIAV